METPCPSFALSVSHCHSTPTALPLRRFALCLGLLTAACGKPPSNPITAPASNPNGLNAIALTGCFQNAYTAVVKLGDSLSYNLLMDSGSAALALAGSQCSNCTGISPLYTPGATATDQNKMVRGSYGGANGWTGKIYTENVALTGPLGNVSMNVADIVQQSSNTNTTTAFFTDSYCSGRAVGNSQQGILGMASSTLGPAGVDSLADKLAATGKVADAFAVQLCDLDGRMWLGGFDPSFTTAAPQYVPMDISSGFYIVQLRGISIGGKALSLPAGAIGNSVADTGTSVMLTTDAVLAAVAAAVEANPAYLSAFGRGFLQAGNCQSAMGAPSRQSLDSQLPTMALVFDQVGGGAVTLTLPATSSYLIATQAPGGVTIYCPAILGGAMSGSRNLNAILGNSLMHSHVTIFDRQHSQLGFAPQKNCTKTLQ
jgi:hypothetical protein